eukprot:gb/GECH01001491.1/.p1 GENE.gb/GECH01001491.1/~~gb/GECH01001491.1/.p1  ORF type:complete len:965 (+),score=215.97 gb/GECH01001491.1/:1-2895(+)
MNRQAAIRLQSQLAQAYTALDEQHNPSAAVRHCNTILRQHPNHLHSSAVLALAQLRMGRPRDAAVTVQPVVDAVLSNVKNDGIVIPVPQRHQPSNLNADIHAFLVTLGNVLRGIRRWELYRDVFAAVVKVHPTWSTLSSLFIAAVWCRDILTQQRAAMQLHRAFKKPEHILWAGAAAARQTSSPRLVQLPLRLLDTALHDEQCSRGTRQEAALLRIDLQRRLGRWRSLWEDMAAPDTWGGAVEEEERLAVMAEAAAMMTTTDSEWSDGISYAMGLYRYLLTEYNADQWSWWQSILDHVDKENANTERSSSSPSSESESTITICLSSDPSSLPITLHPLRSRSAVISFAHHMQEKHPRLRGPYLAEIAAVSASGGEVSDLIVSYVGRFGSKGVCAADLQPYLPAPDDTAADTLAHALRQPEYPDRHPYTVHDILARLHRYTRASPLMETYLSRNKSHLGKEGGDTNDNDAGLEWNADDRLLVLAAYSILRQPNQANHDHPSQRIQDPSIGCRAASVLELGLHRSGTNFHLRVHLGRVYAGEGAVRAGMRTMEAMDVKHVQRDALAYLVVYDMVLSPFLQDATRLLSDTYTFFTDHDRQEGDIVMSAYKNCALSKIDEFRRFTDRVRYSAVRYTAMTEAVLLRVRSETTPGPRLVTTLRIAAGEPYQDETFQPIPADSPMHHNDDLSVLHGGPVTSDPYLAAALNPYFINHSARDSLIRSRRLGLALLYQHSLLVMLSPKLRKQLPQGSAIEVDKETSAIKFRELSDMLKSEIECPELSEQFSKWMNTAVAAGRVGGKLAEMSPKLDSKDTSMEPLINQLHSAISQANHSLSQFTPASNVECMRVLMTALDHLRWIVLAMPLWAAILGTAPGPKQRGGKATPSLASQHLTSIVNTIRDGFKSIVNKSKALQYEIKENNNETIIDADELRLAEQSAQKHIQDDVNEARARIQEMAADFSSDLNTIKL